MNFTLLKSIIFIGRTDAESEAPILWPPDAKNWLIGKDPDAGIDWRWEKGTTADEMVGWHHQLDGHEFEQILGDGEGQGSLACCSPWGHKESDTTEWLYWTKEHYKSWLPPGPELQFRELYIHIKIYAYVYLYIWMWELDHKENWLLRVINISHVYKYICI